MLDLGLSGTERNVLATTELKLCGGIEVTASHNLIKFTMDKDGEASESEPLDNQKVFPIPVP